MVFTKSGCVTFKRTIPDFTRQQAEKIRELMNAHVVDCIVTGYETLIPSLTMPDPDDRHVLAAAIRCGADLIVTFNLKDFPEAVLKPLASRHSIPTTSSRTNSTLLRTSSAQLPSGSVRV